jgi:hypothetical protein
MGHELPKKKLTATLWQRAFIAPIHRSWPPARYGAAMDALQKASLILLSVTMAGSLFFGVTYHFLVPGSDKGLELHNGHWESLCLQHLWNGPGRLASAIVRL